MALNGAMICCILFKMHERLRDLRPNLEVCIS